MSIGVKIEAQYEEFVSATKALQGFFGGVMDGMKSALHDMSEQAKADMKGHESATEQFANVLKGSMKGVTGAVEGVKIAWAQLAAIAGAGAFLKDAVDETVKMTVESQKLGRTLGISATQASYLRLAINDVHGTTDQYIALTKGLDTQLQTNEKGMRKFGLETRDADGHLKDQQTLVMEALEVLRSYKEGTDRNIAAQVLFGKGVNASSEMLALNAEKLAETKRWADALALATGADDVEAVDKFRSAMGQMGDILEAVQKAIGSALLPVLNDLATWFSDYGPQAILAIKVALDIVISLFKGLTLAVKVLWDVVKAAFDNMVTSAQGFASVFSALFHGDFEGAKAAAEATFGTMRNRAGAMFKEIMDDAAATGDSLKSMWGGLINGSPTKDSGKEAGGTQDADITKPGKKPKDTSAADARRAAAEAKREAKEKYDALMEGYRGEEQAAKDHYDKILAIQRKELAAAIAMYGEKSKQAIDIENRIAETERQAAEQAMRLDQMRAESARNLALGQIDIEERAADAREQMGLITYQELLALARGYEEERYNIMRQGLLDEAAANIERVEEHQATKLRLEELDQAHQARVADIANQAAIESAQPMKQVFATIQQSGANALNGLIMKTMTWGQAVRSVCQSVLGSIVNMFTQWLAKAAMNYLQDAVMHKANAVSKAAVDKATTLSGVTRSAAEAGAAGTASFAGAPWPINMGAPAFGAAMFASTMAYAAGASAEGGYDIPAGINPVTQLHQREMVLPERHADVIRDMADNGGGRGDTYNINISAVDGRSVAKFFDDHGDKLVRTLRNQARDFSFRGK